MESTLTKEGICETSVFDCGSKARIGPTSADCIGAIAQKGRDKCRHFSIRAYVAEFRRKDWETCWPFSSLGDYEESKKQSDMLPQLHVPEFRWWDCQNCLRRTDASDIRLVFNPSEHNICGSRNSDVETSVDVIGSELFPLTHDCTKEKVDNIMYVTRQETINLNVPNSGSVELGHANCGSFEVNEGVIKCANNSFTEVFQKGKGIVSVVARTSEQVEDVQCRQKPELGTLDSEVVGFHASKLYPLELTEKDDEKDAHDFSSPILSSRKPQKFRLLTEILRRDNRVASTKISSTNGKTGFHDIKTKETQTQAADEPDGLCFGIPSEGQISVENNVQKDIAGWTKKRKALQIEDWEQRTRWSKSVSTNVRNYKSDKENTCIDSAIGNCKSVNEAIVREGLHSHLKSEYSLHWSERKVIPGKKKKTIQVSPDGLTERGLHPSISLNLAAQGADLNHGVLNARATYKNDLVSDLKTSMVLAEGDRSTTYQDVYCSSTKPGIVPLKTSKEKASKRGYHSFVKYCVALEETVEESAFKNQKCEVHRAGNAKISVMTHPRVIPKDQGMNKEIAYAAQVATGAGSHSCLKTKKATSRQACSSIKKNNMSQIQDGASPMCPKDFSFVYGCENKTDVQGHSEAIKDQSTGRTNKMNELESLNGIPVEIVELLAKNRHERRRVEAENSKENKLRMLKKTKNVTDSEESEFREFHDNGMSRYPLGNNLKKREPRSNAVVSISAAGSSMVVEPVEESVAHSSRLKQTCKNSTAQIKHLEESRDTKGAFAFSASPVINSSGKQFSKAGTSKNLCIQSRRWDGDKQVRGWPNSSFQCLTSCHKRRIVSSPTQSRGECHVSLPNVADSPLRIESFQKSANSSQTPNRNIHLETFKKINAEQPCACTQKFFGNFPNPVGQLELSSNGPMPATQLLKLMDTGMISKGTRNADESIELTNQPLFSQTTHRKGIFPINGGPLTDSSSKYIPAAPISDAFAFPVQRDKNCGGRSQILGEKRVNERPKSSRMKKRKSSNCLTLVQGADSKLHSSLGNGGGGLGKEHDPFPVDGLMAKLNRRTSSTIEPSKSHLIENSIGDGEVEKQVGTVGLVEGSYGTVEQLNICYLNRNPADFSIPEAGNVFTIEGGDLKLRKMGLKRGRPRLRMMNLLAIKESAAEH